VAVHPSTGDGAPVREARRTLASNVRERREELGLSQEALAERSGLHRTEISLLERAERSPRLETLIALGRGLDLEATATLLDGIS